MYHGVDSINDMPKTGIDGSYVETYLMNSGYTIAGTTKQEEGIISHIMTLSGTYLGKSVWEEFDDFESIEAVETLRKCGITEGTTVPDMGCGHGHYMHASIEILVLKNSK